VNGFQTIYPTPQLTMFMDLFRTAADLFFAVLLLVTAKGWGVVRPKLFPGENQMIALFAIGSFIIFFFQHYFQNSRELMWMTLVCYVFIFVWIFQALRHTRQSLNLSSRSDRANKLEMYTKLFKLLWIAIQIWALSIIISIIVIIAVFINHNGLFVGFQIPPKMSWDIALLVLQIGFGYIWAPSPITALYSYSFIRQEAEENQEGDDNGANSFGLEHS